MSAVPEKEVLKNNVRPYTGDEFLAESERRPGNLDLW